MGYDPEDMELAAMPTHPHGTTNWIQFERVWECRMQKIDRLQAALILLPIEAEAAVSAFACSMRQQCAGDRPEKPRRTTRRSIGSTARSLRSALSH